MNYNRIILIGRLTRDPEMSYTPSGVPVTKFAIAVDRPQSSEARQSGAAKETDFFDVVTWRQLAENAANYLQKGRLVVVEGRIQIRNYVAQDGQQRKAVEVVADNFRNLQSRGDGEGGDGAGGNQDNGYEQPAPRAAAPAPAAQRGGTNNGGGDRGGSPAPARQGGGGYDRGNAGAAGGRRQPAPAANDPFGDDDIADPFAE